MTLARFRALSAHNRALVAIAVLLDGHEASGYLASDAVVGMELASVAEEFSTLSPELRNVLAGHHLRSAIAELHERHEHSDSSAGEPSLRLQRGEISQKREGKSRGV